MNDTLAHGENPCPPGRDGQLRGAPDRQRGNLALAVAAGETAPPETLAAILAEMRAAVRDSFASKLVAEYEETGRLDEAPAAQALKDDDDYIASLADRIEAAERERAVDENTSDGYHTFRELYRYRMLYNAAFFNMLSRHTGIAVVKSRRHGDGELCFGGGWFVVMAQLPTGQVSNHYEDRYWGLFCVPEVEMAPEWDGHTPNDAADRLESFLEMRKPDSDRSNPPGNVAAMRGAILAIKEVNDKRPHDAAGYEINDIIEEALAAPARNADKFDDYHDAVDAWKANERCLGVTRTAERAKKTRWHRLWPRSVLLAGSSPRGRRRGMNLKIDEVDFDFICRVLSRAKAEFKERMMDTSITERYRNHFRESAKMANTARDMMFAAKHDAEKEGADHA